jgi:hypothetical protein
MATIQQYLASVADIKAEHRDTLLITEIEL